MPRSCCPPSPCGRPSRPRDYHADSATSHARRPASGLAGPPPAARRARDASHVHHDPFDRVGSWLYPYSTSGEHSQSLAGHHAQVDKPGVERAAVNQSGVVAVDDPCPPGSGSFLQSRASDTSSLSLYLSVSLARTRASGSAARPSHRRGRFTPRRAIPRPGWPPASPGRCISPGPAFQPARMRCCRPSSPFAWRLVAQDLSPRHRQHRDHRHRPRPPRPDDPRQQLPTRLNRQLAAEGARRPRLLVLVHRSSPTASCAATPRGSLQAIARAEAMTGKRGMAGHRAHALLMQEPGQERLGRADARRRPGQERLSRAARRSHVPQHERGAIPVVVPSPAHITERVLRHTSPRPVLKELAPRHGVPVRLPLAGARAAVVHRLRVCSTAMGQFERRRFVDLPDVAVGVRAGSVCAALIG
jgi:hypothetical protein